MGADILRWVGEGLGGFVGPEFPEAIKAAPAAPDGGGPGAGFEDPIFEGGAFRAFHGDSGRLSTLRGPGLHGVGIPDAKD